MRFWAPGRAGVTYSRSEACRRPSSSCNRRQTSCTSTRHLSTRLAASKVRLLCGDLAHVHGPEATRTEAKGAYAAYQAALARVDQASGLEDPQTAEQRLWALARAAPARRPAAAQGGIDHDKLLGAILGAACGDAASMGLHWLYDMDKLKARVGDDLLGAAFHEPQNCFYSYASGSPSPYGQQTLALLRSIAETGGFSPEAYAARNFSTFSAPAFISSGGYLDGSTRGFLRNVQAGAAWPLCGTDDSQANCVCRLPPLVALFAGDAALIPCVADMIRVTQNNNTAVAWGCAAARVLEAIILGAPPSEAVTLAIAALEDSNRTSPLALDADVAAAMKAAYALREFSHADAVSQLGRNCHLPGCVQSPVHALVCTVSLRLPGQCSGYQVAVTDTILQVNIESVFGACCQSHSLRLPSA